MNDRQSDFPSINLDEYPQAFKWGSIPYNSSTTKMAATGTYIKKE